MKTKVDEIVKKWEEFQSVDGRKLYKFQRAGAAFAIESNGRCLIADEMGLGKTVQALAFLWYMGVRALPALVVTKSTLKYQWSHESYRFLGEGVPESGHRKQESEATDGAWVQDRHYLLRYAEALCLG